MIGGVFLLAHDPGSLAEWVSAPPGVAAELPQRRGDPLRQNFGRPHKSIANPYPRTPAMAAGIADHIWTCEEIAALLD
jgi:hypothetical protein